MTEAIDASPKAAAMRKLRLANSTSLRRSSYQAEIESTNMAPVT